MQKRKLISLLALFGLCVANYGISFDRASGKDEAVLAVSVVVLAVLYMAVLRKLFSEASRIESLVQNADKNSAFRFFNIEKTGNAESIERLLNECIKTFNITIKFINEVKAGKLNETFAGGKTDQQQNELTRALSDLQKYLVEMAELESQRRWVSDSMTKFVEILKTDYKNESLLFDAVIGNLVKFLGANQGGLFLVEDEAGEKHLTLAASYAYNRKKFIDKKIAPGEGLIGQAYLEGQTVVLKQIPDNYVTISSGLGEARPKFLLIVPFKFNEQTECIVELASFAEFKEYQVQFLEKLGESIASTIAARRVNDTTRKLLEETQHHTEELRAQEEEMRQNMEELEATQEEMARKEKELTRLLAQSDLHQKEVKNKMLEIENLKETNLRENKKMLDLLEKNKTDIIEILNAIPAKIFLKDSKGYMVLCNDAVAKSYNLPVKELIGTHDKDHFDAEQVKTWREQELAIMKNGAQTFVQEERLNGRLLYLKTTKMPFYISHLNENGLLGFQFDVTDSYKKESV